MKLLDKDLWEEVLETHGRNKRRSIVTAFGVFWGILMLIILLSLSSGFSNGLRYMTQSVSTNGAVLWAGSTSVAYKGLNHGRTWNLRLRDMERLRHLVPELTEIGGAKRVNNDSPDNISFQDTKTSGNIMGVTERYFELDKIRILFGRTFSVEDHRQKRKYCLLGRALAVKLFGSDVTEGLGQIIKVKNNYYTIIAIVDKVASGAGPGTPVDQNLYLPYSVVNMTEKAEDKLDQFLIDIRPGSKNAQVIERCKTVLKSYNQISPEDKTAVGHFDFSEVFATFEGMHTGINILVWIVGIGTLLTGIFGISNILLVTVRERTQEIGVRRALGARPRDIITQLLLEALSLTLIAGLMGIILGVGFSALIASLPASQGASAGDGGLPFYNPTVSLGVVGLSLAIIILSGLLAGVLPAIKAVEIKAIEAIREE